MLILSFLHCFSVCCPAFASSCCSAQGFDDSGLISLAFKLTGLRRLSLSASKVTYASLIAVAQLLVQLTELDLALCQMVTDRGALRLTNLRHLQLLDNIASGITDEGQQSVYAAVSS